MKATKTTLQLAILSVLWTVFAAQTFAGEERYSSRLQGTAIVSDIDVETYDPYTNWMQNTPDWRNTFHIPEKSVLLTLKYDESDLNYYDNYWQAVVVYSLYLLNDSLQTDTILGDTLTIDYHNSASTTYYKDVAWRKYEGYIGATVHIDTVLLLNDGGTASSYTMPSDVVFEAAVEESRYFLFDDQTAPTVSAALDTTGAGGDFLHLDWDYLAGAESFDLEWRFIDLGEHPFSFDNLEVDWSEATRINVSDNRFSISLAYPRGVIAWRVRGVGVDAENERYQKQLFGAWSTADNTFSAYDATNGGYGTGYEGLETDLNWQYSVTWSEHGVSKELVSFFDGSLRNRQSVTVLNSDTTAIVGETAFDYQGRGTVQIMPVPVRTDGIRFYHHPQYTDKPFNYGFGPGDFDLDTIHKTSSTYEPHALNDTAMASHYYSPDNNLDANFRDFIPDAHGYAYAQTRLKPDPTGRPVETTMPGDTFHLKDGHTTRYYYGSPTQTDLDRLFGNEVGYQSHYERNLIQDANGQVSVQYKDQNGRIIATALAGASPGNLDTLDHRPEPETFTTDLLDGNNFPESSGLGYSSTKVLTIGNAPDTLDFTYSLAGTTSCDTCLTTAIECTTCTYNLLLTVQDEEGDYLYPTGITTETEAWQNGISAQSTLNFSVPIAEIGSYTVTKRLVLAEAYRDSVADTLSGWLDANRASQNCVPWEAPDSITTCEVTCEQTCATMFWELNSNQDTVWYDMDVPANTYTDNGNGTWTDNSGTVYYSFPQAVTDAIDSCLASCTTLELGYDPCQIQLNALAADMSPGGQYFDNTVRKFLRDTISGSWSTDSTGNRIDNPNYNANGWLSGNLTLSQVNDSLGTSFTAWDSLRTYWEPEYGLMLAKFHPEYCAFMEFCHPRNSTCDSIAIYDQWMHAGSTNAWAEGNSDASGPEHDFNFMNPLGLTWDTTHTVGASSSNTTYISSNASGYSNDPIDCLLSSYDLDTLGQGLTHFLTFKRTDNQATISYSIWYVLDDPDNIAGNTKPSWMPDYIHDFFTNLHGSGGQQGLISTSPSGAQLTPFQFLRSVYDFHRGLAIYKKAKSVLAAGTGSCITNISNYWDPDANFNHILDTTLFTLRFPRNPMYEFYPDGAGFMVDTISQINCQNLCEAAVDTWWETLDTCLSGMSTSSQLRMRDQLLAVCALSCDSAGGYMGSSNGNGIDSIYTTSSSTPGWAFTFEDVIEDWLGSACDTVPVYPNWPEQDNNCNCSLLDSVAAPHNSGSAVVSPTELVAITDSINSFQLSYSYDTTTVRGWLNYCAGNGNPPDLTWPQEIECTTCKCENFLAWAEENEYVGDWDTLSVPGINTLVAALNSELSAGTNYAEVVAWIAECTGTEEANPLNFGNFPDTLRCLIQPQPIENLDSLLDAACANEANTIAWNLANEAFQQHLLNWVQSWTASYNSNCLDSLNHREVFTMEYTLDEYYYTLYYYDQAGNLVKTVPPEGVLPISNTDTLDAIKLNRRNNAAKYLWEQHDLVYPQHRLITNYKYNAYNQVIEQTTPDGGTSRFWYDQQGRVVASQNARQALYHPPGYSYTIYDDINGTAGGKDDWRIIEVGELRTDSAMSAALAEGRISGYTVSDWLNTWQNSGNSRRQVTQTRYDEALSATTNSYFAAHTASGNQELLRDRVATTTYEETYDGIDTTYNTASHYSYDIHGNVNHLVQENRALAHLNQHVKHLAYQYDLVSGNVTEVAYQQGQPDQLFHRYCYDADNRITEAYTSTDNVVWDRDAKYFYYPHGPLARTETGDKQVQASDLAYTLQGWLKAVNSSTLEQTREIGRDGDEALADNPHAHFGRDAMGFHLSYYQGDYQPIDSSVDDFLALENNASMNAEAPNLFNGNISKMVTALLDNDESPLAVHGNVYQYDQLNRLKGAGVWTASSGGVRTSNAFSSATNSGAYAVELQYDLNGNIERLHRADNTGAWMDSLIYTYPTDAGRTVQNRLLHVQDDVANSTVATDYENALAYSASTPNFSYDAIGQLTKDVVEGIDTIGWTVYNKVDTVLRNLDHGGAELAFAYGPDQTRWAKTVMPHDSSVGRTSEDQWATTFYVRDAAGNVMAVYNRSYNQLLDSNTAVAQLAITAGNPGETAIIYVYTIGDITPNPVPWQTDIPTTAQAIADSINAHTGSTGYTASALGANITVVAPSASHAGNAVVNSVSTNNIHIVPDTLVGSNNRVFREVLALSEQHLYGSKRLGMKQQGITLRSRDIIASINSNTGALQNIYEISLDSVILDTTSGYRHLGIKAFECSNHLGNVLATVSDRKLAVEDGSTGTTEYYTADVVSFSDYYPFGMLMPNRTGGESRYGFNGMEMDDEMYETAATSYTTEYRQYDARLGRWTSLDPLAVQFPRQSPYVAFDNNPIFFIDPLGLAAGEPDNPHGAPEAKEGDLTAASYPISDQMAAQTIDTDFQYRNKENRLGYNVYWVPNGGKPQYKTDEKGNPIRKKDGGYETIKGGSYWATPYLFVPGPEIEEAYSSSGTAVDVMVIWGMADFDPVAATETNKEQFSAWINKTKAEGEENAGVSYENFTAELVFYDNGKEWGNEIKATIESMGITVTKVTYDKSSEAYLHLHYEVHTQSDAEIHGKWVQRIQ